MKRSVIALVLVILGFAVYWFLFRSKAPNEPATSARSIAVLPFANLDADSSQTYFTDGLTEGIINSLAHLKNVKVSARSSAFKFRGKKVDTKEVGSQLGVQLLLEGSVQRQGDRVRVNARLVNAEDGFNLWSEQYDEHSSDAFLIEDKISKGISDKLQTTLLAARQDAPNAGPGIAAYELYLKGRAGWNKRTPPAMQEAIGYFSQAIALDSGYALAWSGIADCYTALGYGSFLAPAEAFPKALTAANHALQLDPTLSAPHASLGYYEFYYNWDWTAAEQQFRKAISLNPNDELAYDWYGYYLTSMKRYDEAATILHKASELDPISAPINTDIGFSRYYAGNYDGAADQMDQSLKIDPNLPLTHLWLGRVYEAQKKYSDAIAQYKTALAVNRSWPVSLAQIGHLYGVSGDTTNARAILDTLLNWRPKKYVTSYGVALVYAGLNAKDSALAWLNIAYTERSHWLVWLRSDPRWDDIRGDKRFVDLVARVGLPQ